MESLKETIKGLKDSLKPVVFALMLSTVNAQAGIVEDAKENPDSKILISGCAEEGFIDDKYKELKEISLGIRAKRIPRSQIRTEIKKGICDTSISLEKPIL